MKSTRRAAAPSFTPVHGHWHPDQWNAAVRVQCAVRDAVGMPLPMVLALTALAETLRAEGAPPTFRAALIRRIEALRLTRPADDTSGPRADDPAEPGALSRTAEMRVADEIDRRQGECHWGSGAPTNP